MKNFKIKVTLKNGIILVDTIPASKPGIALLLFAEKNSNLDGEFTDIKITIEND